MYKLTPNSLWSSVFQFPCKIQKHKIGMCVPARALFWELRPKRAKFTQLPYAINHSSTKHIVPACRFFSPKEIVLLCFLHKTKILWTFLKKTETKSIPFTHLPFGSTPYSILIIFTLIQAGNLNIAFCSYLSWTLTTWLFSQMVFLLVLLSLPKGTWLGSHPAVCLSWAALFFILSLSPGKPPLFPPFCKLPMGQPSPHTAQLSLSSATNLDILLYENNKHHRSI